MTTPPETTRAKPRILCVDDEPMVLEGLQNVLRRQFTVVTALGGEAGLLAIEKEGPFEAVMADMRMPGMDGAAFLSAVRQRAPESIRLLLTGQADVASAIAAVNEGRVFRFLTKPCAPQQLIAALDDAVREKRREDARSEATVRLVEDLQEADRLQEEFLSNVSHELKTPLSVIMSTTDLLLTGFGGPLSAEQRELLAAVDLRSRDLLALIEDILRARELDQGEEVSSAAGEIPFSTFLDAVEAAAHDRMPRAGVEFRREFPEERGGTIIQDLSGATAIVRTLLHNACKFTEAGTVRLSVIPEATSVTIVVEDTGVGIPPEQLATIFRRFRQGDGSATRRFGGVGLGLYVAKRLVERQGGEITATSEPDKGSRFYVRFPGYRPLPCEPRVPADRTGLSK